MHVLFFTPYFNQPRGNATTSKRIIHFLQKQGIQTSVVPYEERDLWHIPDVADVIHILHATRFVAWSAENHYTLDRPYVITMGGTDINMDLQNEMSFHAFDLLDKASYITVFTKDAREKVGDLHAGWLAKTKIIPQPVWTAWEVREVRRQIDYTAPHILLPAGLRPVKDVLHALPALDRLALDYPELTFTILGANLSDEVFQQVQAASLDRPWFKYAGVVPLEVMNYWYNKANIVINTSISEGQSLAIMEAMAVGRPVIARKNEANKSLIRHRQTGFLYETMEEFVDAFCTIMTDSILREQVIAQAQAWILKHASPEEEAKAYIKLYEEAASANPTTLIKKEHP